MKKTLIALLALGSVAMGETYTEAITLPNSSTFWHRSNSGVPVGGGWSDNFRNTSIPADGVYKVFVAPEAAATGMLYYGCCNGVDGTGSGDVTIVTDSQTKSISFGTQARPANAGEYVALTLSMDSVLEPRKTVTDELVSVTFTFTNDVAKGAYSAWGYTNGDEFVSALGDGAQATQSGSNTIELTSADLQKLNELVFVIGNDKNATQVSGLSVTATFATSTPPVPEPTTGSLSLLALAGLCARRRKK